MSTSYAKTAGGRPRYHVKVWLKIEQIARLRCAGISDIQIRRMLGISPSSFNRIINLSEYKECEAAAFAGSISKLDEIIGLRTDAMRLFFASAVPASMRALVDTVLQKRDLKSRLEAAKEILDRDPRRTFVKSTKGDSESLHPELPISVIESLGKHGEAVALEAEKAQLGPSGKPN